MGRDIVLGLEMRAGPKTITEALTTAEGLRSFWTSDVTAEPVAGSEASFGFPGAPMPLQLTVERIEPGSRVEWTRPRNFPFWDETTISWELSEGEAGGARVLFRQAGFPDAQPEWAYASIAQTWAMVLARLQVLTETGSAEPALG